MDALDFFYRDHVFPQNWNEAVAPVPIDKDATQQVAEQEVVGNVVDNMWYMERKLGG